MVAEAGTRIGQLEVAWGKRGKAAEWRNMLETKSTARA